MRYPWRKAPPPFQKEYSHWLPRVNIRRLQNTPKNTQLYLRNTSWKFTLCLVWTFSVFVDTLSPPDTVEPLAGPQPQTGNNKAPEHYSDPGRHRSPHHVDNILNKYIFKNVTPALESVESIYCWICFEMSCSVKSLSIWTGFRCIRCHLGFWGEYQH